MCPHITGAGRGRFGGVLHPGEGICTLGACFWGDALCLGHVLGAHTCSHVCVTRVLTRRGQGPLGTRCSILRGRGVRTEPPSLCQGMDEAPWPVWGCTGCVLPPHQRLCHACVGPPAAGVCVCRSSWGAPNPPFMAPNRHFAPLSGKPRFRLVPSEEPP